MKYVFLGTLALLIVLSIVAVAIRPAAVQDGKTVLVWTVDDNPTRRHQIALFNDTHDDYLLQIDSANADLSKVIVQSVGGVGPDLVSCTSSFALSALVTSGIAWDITEEVAGFGIDLENDLWSGVRPYLLYDGRVYGVGNNVAVDALWYHPEMFEEAGLPRPTAPWTWEEFIPIARQLMVRDDDGTVERYGFLFGWYQWPMFMRQWGGRVYSEDGTRCELDCPETVAAIQFMQDLIYTHGISPTPEQETAMATEGGWGSGMITWYGGRRAATALGGRWWLMALRNYEGIEYAAVEPPHGPLRAYHSYARSTVINRNSPRREDALVFLRFLLSQDYNELINRQGDGIGPAKAYSFSKAFLHDPETPGPEFNAVWRDVLHYGIPEHTSIFVNGGVVDRIVNQQLDLVRSNVRTADEAMREATRRVNREIEQNIERAPTLRARYEAIVSQREGAGSAAGH